MQLSKGLKRLSGIELDGNLTDFETVIAKLPSEEKKRVGCHHEQGLVYYFQPEKVEEIRDLLLGIDEDLGMDLNLHLKEHMLFANNASKELSWIAYQSDGSGPEDNGNVRQDVDRTEKKRKTNNHAGPRKMLGRGRNTKEIYVSSLEGFFKDISYMVENLGRSGGKQHIGKTFQTSSLH